MMRFAKIYNSKNSNFSTYSLCSLMEDNKLSMIIPNMITMINYTTESLLQLFFINVNKLPKRDFIG